MDRDPIGTATRHTRRNYRLGNGSHICILCGCSDPVALIKAAPDWLKRHGIPNSLLEKHHPAGRHHDPELTVLICRNCHAILHEGLLQAGVNMRPEPDPILRIATMLEASAQFNERLAAQQLKWAESLKIYHQERNQDV